MTKQDFTWTEIQISFDRAGYIPSGISSQIATNYNHRYTRDQKTPPSTVNTHNAKPTREANMSKRVLNIGIAHLD
jgi:hypothetical protein